MGAQNRQSPNECPTIRVKLDRDNIQNNKDMFFKMYLNEI